jgi:glycosyltransferase involved in cell wall biosynthesis
MLSETELSKSVDSGQVDLSIVIPIYNEAGNLAELYQRLDKALSLLPHSTQIVFVDDGSTDGSRSLIEDFCRRDGRVTLVALRRNLGKAGAYQAGFCYARGDVIVTLDGDLQDDPQEISRFLAKIEEGYDFVAGWKHAGKTPASKGIPSKIFNWVVARVTGLPLHDFNCPFRAFRRSILRELQLYGELHRFIPLLVAQQGYRLTEIPVTNSPRIWGESKYGWKRYTRGYLDFLTVLFLTRYIHSPLHLFGTVGTTLFAVGFAIDGYLTLAGWLRGNIGHTAMLLLGILLMLAGMQLFSVGLLAELLVRQRSGALEALAIDRVVRGGQGSGEKEGIPRSDAYRAAG